MKSFKNVKAAPFYSCCCCGGHYEVPMPLDYEQRIEEGIGLLTVTKCSAERGTRPKRGGVVNAKTTRWEPTGCERMLYTYRLKLGLLDTDYANDAWVQRWRTPESYPRTAPDWSQFQKFSQLMHRVRQLQKDAKTRQADPATKAIDDEYNATLKAKRIATELETYYRMAAYEFVTNRLPTLDAGVPLTPEELKAVTKFGAGIRRYAGIPDLEDPDEL